MKAKQEQYYAKIMLFGEYGVICDSMGLTIPYAHFKGELNFINDEQYTEYEFALTSNKYLREYLTYIEDLTAKGVNIFKFDIEAYKRDLDAGLYFESTIPQGYGLGSSGALCAALYNTYAINGISQKRYLNSTDIAYLKEVFSQMESYFHGVSSGIDPLLCYVKYPLLIKSKTDIHTVGIPRNKLDNNGAIFLVNTGSPGKTEPLVKLFFEWCENDDFNNLVNREMIPANNACIDALLNGELSTFFNQLKRLSEFQISHFKPMIPQSFETLWHQGLESGKFYFKLCGSGGGGFLLGLTPDYEEAKKVLAENHVEPILVYRKS